MFNKIILLGRVGKDPEAFGESGAGFTMATDEWDSVAKERVPMWHRIKCFNKTAEFVLKHVHKGTVVIVDGRFVARKYQHKESGEERTAYEVIANQVTFGGGNASGSGGQREEPPKREPTKKAPPIDDTLPF